jgi:hypothetical protein
MEGVHCIGVVVEERVRTGGRYDRED